MDNDNEVKVILPINFFLTETVKEIKCKPICCLACKFEFFYADTVLFENTATIRTKDYAVYNRLALIWYQEKT